MDNELHFSTNSSLHLDLGCMWCLKPMTKMVNHGNNLFVASLQMVHPHKTIINGLIYLTKSDCDIINYQRSIIISGDL